MNPNNSCIDVEKLLGLEAKLTSHEMIVFMVSLGFNLTITARNTYKVSSDEVESPFRLRGINEIEHRVLSRAAHLLDGTANGSLESFVMQIINLANHYGCQLELNNAVEFTLERISHVLANWQA